MPEERSGIASALLNNSRELAGLLGITVIGAVLRTRQGFALRHGAAPTPAFIDGYHAGLAVTIALVAVGAVVGYAALRRPARPAPAPEQPSPAAQAIPAAEAVPAVQENQASAR
jgi:hypothetical protein